MNAVVLHRGRRESRELDIKIMKTILVGQPVWLSSFVRYFEQGKAPSRAIEYAMRDITVGPLNPVRNVAAMMRPEKIATRSLFPLKTREKRF